MVAPTTHKIMNIAGLTRFHFPGDLMHTGCLGVVQYLVGSVLYELVFEGPFGRPKEALDKVWGMIRERYSVLGIKNRL